MPLLNRHMRIGSRSHLGKSIIADFNFKTGAYKVFGNPVAVGDFLGTDAALGTFTPAVADPPHVSRVGRLRPCTRDAGEGPASVRCAAEAPLPLAGEGLG